jgi:hypothetical protein
MVTAQNSLDDCLMTPRLTPMRKDRDPSADNPLTDTSTAVVIEAVGGVAARFGYQATEGLGGRRRPYRTKGTSILVERLYAGYVTGNWSVRLRSSMVAL